MIKRLLSVIFLFGLVCVLRGVFSPPSAQAIYACNTNCAPNPGGCDAPNYCYNNSVCRNANCNLETDCSCPYGACNICSAAYKYSRASGYYSKLADCSVPAAGSTVTRTCDCGCGETQPSDIVIPPSAENCYNRCYHAACNGTTGQCVQVLGALDAGDSCSPSGSQRTSGWGAFGSCKTTTVPHTAITCGSGRQYQTCNCGNENACTFGCTGPVGACWTGVAPYGEGSSAENFQACCVSQGPVTAPVITGTSLNDCSAPADSIHLTWTYFDNSGGCSGDACCGTSWGLNCSGNNNTFKVKVDANPDITVGSGVREVLQLQLGNWGAHTIQVCANNGTATENCATTNINTTAPVCGTFNRTRVSGPIPGNVNCYKSFPSLSASAETTPANTCGDHLYFDNTGPTNCASGWLAAAPNASWVPTCGVSTGNYNWTVQAHSETTPAKCTPVTSVADTYTMDNQPPAVPGGGAIVFTPNPVCLGNYRATYSWNASTGDTGCAGIDAVGDVAPPYKSQLTTSATVDGSGNYTDIVTGWDTSYQMARTQTTTDYYPPNTRFWGHTRAQDRLNTESNWSPGTGLEDVTIPVPSPFPTIHFGGEFIEDIGAGSRVCDDGGTTTYMNIPNPGLVDIQVSGGAGVRVTNKVITATRYDVYVTIDNTSNTAPASYCASPTQDITMSATYPGYTTVGWRNNACATDPDQNTQTGIDILTLNGGNPPTYGPGSMHQDLFFRSYNGSGTGWIKTSNASFISKATSRTNIIPNYLSVYDGDDTVDHVFIAAKNSPDVTSGLVLRQTHFDLGPNAGNDTSPTYSVSNWYNDPGLTPSAYALSDALFDPLKFIDYIKSRKEYKTITALDQITADGLYKWNGAEPLLITSPDVFTHNVVLISTGTVNINVTAAPNKFNPAYSVAILAGTINFANGAAANTVEADGIFIANTIGVGAASTGLKIKGNLIQLLGSASSPPAADLSNTRLGATINKPSLFVVFDPQPYIKLMPYLSVSTYDWIQLQ